MSTIVECYLPNKVRKATAKIFLEYFDDVKSQLIENGIYEYSKQYCHKHNHTDMFQAIYHDRLNDIIFNFQSNKRTIRKLKKMIERDQYNSYNLAFLTPSELDIENWEKIIKRMNTSEYKLKNLATIEWRPCYNCESNEYYYYHLQTRSADEPMTTFYECKECSRKYKINN